MADADRGPTVSDEEILAVFATLDGDRFQVTTVADELPLAADSLVDRLDDLEERGLLVREADTPRDTWGLAPGVAADSGLDDVRVETAVEAQAAKETGAETPPLEAETPRTPPPDPQTDPQGPVRRTPAEALEAFEPPGTAEQRERRRAAVLAAYRYLREQGRADRAAIESAVHSAAHGGYDRPGDWWEEVVRPGLEELPGVSEVGEGEEWVYTADRDPPPPE